MSFHCPFILVLFFVDNSNLFNTPDVEDLKLRSTSPVYGLRSRRVEKLDSRKGRVSRRRVRTQNRNAKVEEEEEEDLGMVCEGTADSQESISMLHGCYEEQTCWENQFPELMETCLNSTLEMVDDEMGESWILKQLPGDGSRNEVGVEKSTQTNFSIFRGNNMAEKDEEARNHANFIGSIIKFKGLLSSKKEVSKKKFWNVLKSISNFDKISSPLLHLLETENEDGVNVNQTSEQTIHTETIGYLLRASDTEKVFLDTVKALLTYLEQALDVDLERLACCWKNSVYEMAVEMINEAVESESVIRKMVDLFLYRIVGSILQNGGELKNLALESKTMFVITFCQSTFLCYDVINFITDKLMRTVEDSGGRSTMEERLNWTRLTNNSYFLYRILETLLTYFKSKLQENEEVEEIVAQETDSKNFNVLEMWKKHWQQKREKEEDEGEDGVRGTGRNQHSFKMTVSKWCDQLDYVLLHCLKHIPICSLPGERCGRLAKDILKMCHPKVMGS